jgi:hypothetical protein
VGASARVPARTRPTSKPLIDLINYLSDQSITLIAQRR